MSGLTVPVLCRRLRSASSRAGEGRPKRKSWSKEGGSGFFPVFARGRFPAAGAGVGLGASPEAALSAALPSSVVLGMSFGFVGSDGALLSLLESVGEVMVY